MDKDVVLAFDRLEDKRFCVFVFELSECMRDVRIFLVEVRQDRSGEFSSIHALHDLADHGRQYVVCFSLEVFIWIGEERGLDCMRRLRKQVDVVASIWFFTSTGILLLAHSFSPLELTFALFKLEWFQFSSSCVFGCSTFLS
jgi:hypothetical protein